MSLRTHSFCAGICAETLLSAHSSKMILSYLAEQFGMDPDSAIHIVSYLVSTHDLGKAHPAFQCKDKTLLQRLAEDAPEYFGNSPVEVSSPSFRHEHYSSDVLRRIWKSRGYSREMILPLSTIASLHHQRPRGAQSRNSPRNKIWELMQDDLEHELSTVFLKQTPLVLQHHVDAVCTLISSIVILMDWVASSEMFCTAEGMQPDAIRDHAVRTLRLYGLISDEAFPSVLSLQDMFPEIEKPRPIQEACAKLCDSASLSIIEAPMGEGKTEAALFLAARQCNALNGRGIYMALPSQATSNQIHTRLDAMLAEVQYGSSRLLHGTAFLSQNIPDNYSTEDEAIAAKWTRPSRMGFLGANAVGTVDQAMAAVLRTRFSMLRLAGLSNKILIIDEIHAYDSYMSQIIETLLRWCHDLCIPVILLSATMQMEQKRRYLSCFGVNEMSVVDGSYPLLTQVLPSGELLQVGVEASSHYHYLLRPVNMEYDASAVADMALSMVTDGGCVAVMVNTVAHAQEVFQVIRREACDDTTVLLFHSRFPLKRRTEIEQQCVSLFGRDRSCRPAKGILVATQVVEQSIDLDFDGMISELAPIDLLLQRAGRLHRHRENPRPYRFRDAVMDVLLPAETAPKTLDQRYGPSGYVYDPFLLWNTEQQITTDRIVKVPEDIRLLVEEAYSSITEENHEAWINRSFGEKLEMENAKGRTWPMPEPDTFFPSETAISFGAADPDDGFEFSSEASTRLGDSGLRIAFCDEADYDRYKEHGIPHADQVGVYLNSVSVRLRAAQLCESSNALQVEKGKLAGIWLLRGKETVELGTVTVINDSELGVSWR